MTSLTSSRKTKAAAGGTAPRIVSPTAGDGYVHYDIAQDLTLSEKAQAQSNISVVPGTDVQPHSSSLDSLVTAGATANRIAYTSASNTWTPTGITPDARLLINRTKPQMLDFLGLDVEYDTVEIMQAATTPACNSVYVHGYAIPGDGGEGFYKKVTADPGWVGRVQQNPPSGQWWELIVPATGLDPRAVGVTFSGIDTASAAAAERTAWNGVISAINSGKASKLCLPPGQSVIDSTLATITASDWHIQGCALGGTTIRMASSSTAFGPYLRIGDGPDAATRWTIDHLRFENLNYVTIGLTAAPVLDIQNAADGFVSYVNTKNTGGFVKLGDSAANGEQGAPIANASRLKFYGCNITDYAPAGGITVDVQSQAGTKLIACNFAATGGDAAASFRGMKIHPLADDEADNMKCIACEWNYGGPDPQYNIEVDATHTSISSQLFFGCVFDQAVAAGGVGANVYVHIDAGKSDNARFNATFSGCVSDASTDADCLLLDNTGGGNISISWVGCSLTQLGAGHLAHVRAGHVDLNISSTHLGSRTNDASAGSAIFIEDGCSGVNIHNNRSPIETNNSTGLPFIGFAHLVKFKGDASECIITGNDATTCRVGCVDTSALGAGNLSSIIIKDNLEAHPRLPFTATTADTTPKIVQTIILDDEASYVFRARVQAQAAAGANQAYYELAALFKRDNGGAATQVGSTSVISSMETNPSWDASFAASGNGVNLVVTGAANVQWWFATEVSAAGAAFA